MAKKMVSGFGIMKMDRLTAKEITKMENDLVNTLFIMKTVRRSLKKITRMG